MAASTANLVRRIATRSNFAIGRALVDRMAKKYLHTCGKVAFARQTYPGAAESTAKNKIPDRHKFIDEEGNVMDATRSDEFGLLVPDDGGDKVDVPLDEGIEYVPESKTEILRTNYSELIKKLLAEGKYQEAVDVVNVTMIQEENIKPSTFAYNLLLGAFGRLGKIEIAFKLYRQMTDRGLKPDASTYTSLFNACANSPDKTEALRRASYLRDKIKGKGETLNTTNYHAMIKAFGLSGDLWSAFQVADEMLEEGHTFHSETLNFLLMACASDREMGFGKALLLWRKYLGDQRKQPDVFSYNLLLRITRDCGVGVEQMRALGPETDDLGFLKKKRALGPGAESADDVAFISSGEEKSVVPAQLENQLETAEDRLKVFDDVEGFLKHMNRNRVRPNLKTFALLLQIAESSTEKEEKLLSLMDELRVKPDVAIFNVLIKKRIYRKDESGAQDAFGRMAAMGVLPDIMTFGTLAIGCRKRSQCVQFLQSMTSAGFRPNIQIMDALVSNVCFQHDWYYVSRLLQLTLDEQIDVEPRLLRKIAKSIDRFKKRICDEEKGIGSGNPLTKYRKDDYRQFLIYYKKWLGRVRMSSPPLLARVDLKTKTIKDDRY